VIYFKIILKQLINNKRKNNEIKAVNFAETSKPIIHSGPECVCVCEVLQVSEMISV